MNLSRQEHKSLPACRHRRSRSSPKPDSFRSIEVAHEHMIMKAIEDRALFDLHVEGDPVQTQANRAAFRANQDQHCLKHLFMVTALMKPNDHLAARGQSLYRSSRVFDAFRCWYFMMCRHLLGPHFTRRIAQQPFTMAFLDVEGTRHVRAPQSFHAPHIHALMLVRPGQIDRFNQLHAEGALRIQGPSELSKIDILPFADDQFGIEPMVTYASKYVRHSLRDPRHDMDMLILPDTTLFRARE